MKRARRLDVTGPIYKLEWYDGHLMAWRPLQRTYSTAEDAARTAHADPAQRWRLMEVSQHGYAPVEMPR